MQFLLLSQPSAPVLGFARVWEVSWDVGFRCENQENSGEMGVLVTLASAPILPLGVVLYSNEN